MILLDTHALLWWQAGSSRLSHKARTAIETEPVAYVPAISAWEIGQFAAKGRLELDREIDTWIRDLEETTTVRFVELTARAAVAASQLPSRGFAGDLADAWIYATAAELGTALVTKDDVMHAFARAHRDVKILW